MFLTSICFTQIERSDSLRNVHRCSERRSRWTSCLSVQHDHPSQQCLTLIAAIARSAYTYGQQVIWAQLMRRATALAVPVRRLSWSYFQPFRPIYPRNLPWSVHRSRKSQKTLKATIFWCSRPFKVIDVLPLKSLLRYAACLCLSATVFTLDEPISVGLKKERVWTLSFPIAPFTRES